MLAVEIENTPTTCPEHKGLSENELTLQTQETIKKQTHDPTFEKHSNSTSQKEKITMINIYNQNQIKFLKPKQKNIEWTGHPCIKKPNEFNQPNKDNSLV